MKEKKIHFAGENHVPPAEGSRGFIRGVERGCPNSYGDDDCGHGYTWRCDDCPVVVDSYNRVDESLNEQFDE